MSEDPKMLELMPMETPAEKPAPENSSETIELVGTDARPKVAPHSLKMPATPADPFEREAAKQYAEGHIDAQLWDRAFAKANNDRDEAAKIYLAARATSLRLLDRDRRAKARASAAPAAAAPTPAPTSDFVRLPPGAREFARATAPSPLKRYAMLGGGVVILLALAAGGYMYFTGADDADASLNAAVPKVARTAPVVPVVDLEQPKGPSPELLQKIEDLRLSGNWNLLVIYTAELARKDPLNPVVWDELRDGYMHLHQYDDARDAAVKAADRAPDQPQMWRNLGEIYVNLNANADAVTAYNRAVALDPKDAASFKQVALLNARMRNLPESKAAIDSALALTPDDTIARCMKTSLSQILADSKDSRAVAMAVDAMDAKCRGLSEVALPAAAVALATPKAVRK